MKVLLQDVKWIEILIYTLFYICGLWSGYSKARKKYNSIMPFGKYKNEKLANVPASYLLWLHKENKCFGEMRKYIEDNMDVLKEEVEKNIPKGQK